MNKYKIIALFGEAGSGKSYIQKQLMNTTWGKMNLHGIVASTTRPPREGEIDGVHYHFLTATAFLKDRFNNKFLEDTVFNDWYYGTHKDDLDITKINIGIFSPKAIIRLLDRNDVTLVPIYIKTMPKIRLMRQLKREASPDCLEICRRFQTDYTDFLNLPFSYKVIENDTNEIKHILDDIISFSTHELIRTE